MKTENQPPSLELVRFKNGNFGVRKDDEYLGTDQEYWWSSNQNIAARAQFKTEAAARTALVAVDIEVVEVLKR